MSIFVIFSFAIFWFSINTVEIKEFEIESKHLVVKCLLKIKVKVIQAHKLIECGAIGIAFVNKDFVHHHELEEKELHRKKIPVPGYIRRTWA